MMGVGGESRESGPVGHARTCLNLTLSSATVGRAPKKPVIRAGVYPNPNPNPIPNLNPSSRPLRPTVP